MYPAVVLGHVAVDAIKLTAAEESEEVKSEWESLTNLMGSPKYWLAIPTVAPVIQMTYLWYEGYDKFQVLVTIEAL